MESTLNFVLKWFIVCSFIIQMGYLFFLFLKFVFYRPGKESGFEDDHRISVSVVICAKNEEKNLKENLPAILNQDYEYCELIVVDDDSGDDSLKVLEEYREQYPKLRIIQIPKGQKKGEGKKQALTEGIRQAGNEIILLTDADCKPSSKQWIKKMCRHFVNPATEIVLGYGGYFKKTGLLNAYIRFDAAYIAFQYFSFALKGMPYMGTGRNLAYRKSIFEKVGGFSNHTDLSSGDDDLFVNQVARKENTVIEAETGAFTYSESESSLFSFVRQKLRHNTTGARYKPSAILFLSLLHFSHFAFIGSFLLFIIYSSGFHLIYTLYLLRVTIQMLIFKESFNKLKEKNLIYYLPFFDIIFGILNPFLVVISQFISKNRWMK